MQVEKSVEEESDGVKIDRIVEKGGKVPEATQKLAEEDADSIAAALKAEGHDVTPDQVALIENELKSEKAATGKGAPPDE